MANLLVLAGDGIGPEVTRQALRVLEAVSQQFALTLEVETGLFGGCSLDAEGVPLTPQLLERAGEVDAVLLGAVGGPAWDGVEPTRRPEAGLLQLRSRMGVYANLRPIFLYPELVASSSLRAELVEGLDLLIVRELIGGIYFGEPRALEDGPPRRGYDTMVYDENEIRRIAHTAFRAASQRRSRLTSVDKANVLASSRLWRAVVTETAQEYPEVQLEHLYVDNAAMQLAREPLQFDVILAGNLFGDILSDLAAVLAGSIGMLPSAALNEHSRGLYEPCHGSAPDLAGQGRANPLAAILSAAMLLRHSLGQEQAAAAVETAARRTVAAGICTADLNPAGGASGTEAVGDRVLQELAAL